MTSVAPESAVSAARGSSDKRDTVLIADDHTSIRQMLAYMIPREGPYEVIGQVSTGLAAIEKVLELKPRLVVLDLLLPELNGIEVVRRLRNVARDTRLLIYTGTTSNELVAEALHAKPHGFVHKEDTLQDFRDALRAVMSGISFVTKHANEMSEKGEGALAANLLTERERDVLRLVAEGLSSKEIADRTGIAVKTVEAHRGNISQKLGLHDVVALTRFAIRHGLASLE
jgi:two-component system, NarL family, response regulator LiaR